MGWHGAWGGFWGLSWIAFFFLAIFLSRLFWWRRGWGCGPGPWRWGRDPYGYWGHDPGQAEEILRARLARGEIDQAEYDRLLEVLRRR